jgi:hypothetical protein
MSEVSYRGRYDNTSPAKRVVTMTVNGQPVSYEVYEPLPGADELDRPSSDPDLLPEGRPT